jgi:hypothetical protein
MWETIGVWVEAIALILIFGLKLKEDRRQGSDRKEERKEKLEQMRLMREQARATKASVDTLINSERARVAAEFVPMSGIASDGRWVNNDPYRVTLSVEDVLAGRHLGFRLRITNLGRTPAEVFAFELSCDPITSGEQFSANALSNQRRQTLNEFLGAGETRVLHTFNVMDALRHATENGAFNVTYRQR